MSSTKRARTDSEASEPSSGRLKLDPTLEYVDNVLNDATHTRLDKIVVDDFKDEPIVASSLLESIVAHSEGQLDSIYGKRSSAKTLLRGLPELKELLNKAWKDQNFKDIRNLSTTVTRITCFCPDCILIAILQNPKATIPVARVLPQEQARGMFNRFYLVHRGVLNEPYSY
jgi:hypothetical protein